MTVTLSAKHEFTKTDDNDNETRCSNEDCTHVDDFLKDLITEPCSMPKKIKEDAIPACKEIYHEKSQMLLNYNEAPAYIKHNIYILSGYRGILNTQLCLQSLFWWTNETINIWSHIFGFLLFVATTYRDFMTLEIQAYLTDKLIMAIVLLCFQLCMLMSALYHTFSCRSQRDCDLFLSFDLFGIALALLAIYVSGVYYAFWCDPVLLKFYLFTVIAIFVTAMMIHFPGFGFSDNVRLYVFVGWAAYGVVPTFHWYLKMGGMENPLVALLLPRVWGMYCISGVAFLIYITKVPERFSHGKFDYLGHSHQWWHIFVLAALYYWHCSGMIYLEYRYNHACSCPTTIS